MKHFALALFIVTIFAFNSSRAQANGEDSAAHGVVLHTDSRLDIVVRKTEPKPTHPGRKSGMISSGRGYRVQIYSGNDRNVATQRKIDFLRRFPGTRTYLTYIAPTFRVKVGDYRDRKSAQAMYQQVSRLYNPCMVVNDIIEINSFHTND
jgi:hypothetical protein